ncbi:FG-GAP-like repeat-containing protein [Streptomyces sp. A5-4]|uniref:FG-GAP-like repeat-containing protein n=1 Tax=Streptomyces sp. A5-4 TaxID=3384771 RepID=UPI003DA99269
MPNHSGRSRSRSRRARRIAACTALALSAGMLLSAPAAADGADDKAPHAAIGQTRPDATPQPTMVLPKRAAKRDAFTGGVGAAGVAKPRTDIDGDGYSDLFYRTMNGELNVKSSGGAEDHVYTINGDSGSHKDIIAPGDLDGEGTPEFLTLSPSGKLSLFQSSGTDNTGVATWSGTGWQIYNKVFSAGDLNGDGRGDVLARTPAGELYLYVTNGAVESNPFSTRVKVGTGWGQFDQLVGANDTNGDGIGDVFARTTNGELHFYAGTGNPAAPLKPRVLVGSGWGQFNQLVAVDDWDTDGVADLAARTPAGDLYWYRSDGTGKFNPKQLFGSGWLVSLLVGSGGNPHFGKSDVLGLDTRGTLFWYWGKTNGLLSPRQQISDVGGWSGAKIVNASSLDKDGWGDLLEVYDNKLYNYGIENSTYYVIGSGWSQYNSIIGPGDLSGDGKGDLLTRDGSGRLYLQRGNGAGTAFAARVNVGSGWGQYNKLVGAGDLTGDGLADVLARTSGGTLYLYAGTGNSSSPFKARKSIGTGWKQYTKLAAPGDINGDGRADLLAANSAGELFSYTSKGTGQFAAKVKLGTGWNTYRELH